MSVAQIEQELTALDGAELDALATALLREKGRRNANVLSAAETRLFEVINQPMPGGKRFQELEPLWEAGTLAEAERAELLQIVEAREEVNARRVEALLELAQVRGVPFATLWRQIMGAPPQPRLVLG